MTNNQIQKQKVPRGYKETKIGLIPNDWDCVRLKDAAEVILSNVDKKMYEGQEPAFLCNYTDVYYNKYITKAIDFMKASASEREFERFSLLQDDVVITKDSEDRNDIAVSALVTEKLANVLCGYHLAIIRPNKKKLLGAFFNKYLELHPVRHYFSTLANGVTRFGLTYRSIRHSLVFLPSLFEQEKIADILSKWDEAIEKTERLISAKQKLKKALCQQLLTGKKRFPKYRSDSTKVDLILGKFSASWNIVPLHKIVKKVTRRNATGETHVLTASGQQGLIDQNDYFNRSVAGADLTGYYLLRNGEYAYNRSRMIGYPYGAIKRLDKYSQGVLSTLYLCFAINSPKVDSDFLKWYFEGGQIGHQLARVTPVGGRAHGLLNITADDFYNIKLMLPPEEEQKTIAGVLNTTQHEIELLEAQVKALKHQKRGLMQKLLTGKIRVKFKD